MLVNSLMDKNSNQFIPKHKLSRISLKEYKENNTWMFLALADLPWKKINFTEKQLLEKFLLHSGVQEGLIFDMIR